MPEFFVKNPPQSSVTEPPKPQPEEPENKSTEDDRIEESVVKTLSSWVAPARPFRKKDRSYYTTIAILVVLLILIAVLAQEFLLIGVIISFAFVAYVIAFVPPDDIEYKISTQGVTVGGHFYMWQELDSFWLSEKDGHKILNILTRLRFPGQLIIPIGDREEDEIKEKVAKYLPFHEIPPRSLMDNWAESLQKHFPLENPQR